MQGIEGCSKLASLSQMVICASVTYFRKKSRVARHSLPYQSMAICFHLYDSRSSKAIAQESKLCILAYSRILLHYYNMKAFQRFNITQANFDEQTYVATFTYNFDHDVFFTEKIDFSDAKVPHILPNSNDID